MLEVKRRIMVLKMQYARSQMGKSQVVDIFKNSDQILI